MMLELHNMRIELSNVKNNKETTKCNKRTVTVMLELHNMRMKPSNMRKKNKGITKCDKRTITCDIGTAQYENETIKCEDLVTWYSRLPTNGYRTQKKKKKREYGRITHD